MIIYTRNTALHSKNHRIGINNINVFIVYSYLWFGES